MVLHNQRLVHSPEDVAEGGNSTLYIGFYLPELGLADLTNCNAASQSPWTFQEKTDGLSSPQTELDGSSQSRP